MSNNVEVYKERRTKVRSNYGKERLQRELGASAHPADCAAEQPGADVKAKGSVQNFAHFPQHSKKIRNKAHDDCCGHSKEDNAMRSWNYGSRSIFRSCQDCAVRHINCHVNCEEYQNELKQNEERKRKAIEEMNAVGVEVARALRWKT